MMERGECLCQVMKRLDMLDVSREQAKKLKALYREHKRKKVQLKAQAELLRLDLQELLDAEEPDLTAIERKVKELAKVKAERMLECIKGGLEVRKILSPEQLEKLHELSKQGMCCLPSTVEKKDKHKRMMRMMGE